jgi:hypothetical protein
VDGPGDDATHERSCSKWKVRAPPLNYLMALACLNLGFRSPAAAHWEQAELKCYTFTLSLDEHLGPVGTLIGIRRARFHHRAVYELKLCVNVTSQEVRRP